MGLNADDDPQGPQSDLVDPGGAALRARIAKLKQGIAHLHEENQATFPGSLDGKMMTWTQ